MKKATAHESRDQANDYEVRAAASEGNCNVTTAQGEGKYDLTYISFGAGVQSTALLACSALGLHGVPKADAAIFMDLQAEPDYVYKHVEFMTKWSGDHGIPLHVLTAGSLEKNLLRTEMARKSGFQVSIPAFTSTDPNGGLLRRQCTTHYKIEPIRKWVREKLGLKPKMRAAGKFMVRAMIGISVDEIMRVKPSGKAWIMNNYPLVDARLNRRDCQRITEEAGLPKAGKSSCIFCPYHSNSYWQEMKTFRPEEFQRAVEVDRSIRDSTSKGAKEPCYLHRSRQPLDQVEFTDPKQTELFGGFLNECEGMCGV